MDLSLLSKYRTSLMGIAALMIIFCHAAGYVLSLPRGLMKLMEFGNLGVDIFLLLSGIGMYYSLSLRSTSLFRWYVHRYKRILIPYLLISSPYWLYVLITSGSGIGSFLSNISTLSYWTNHVGAWYVAMLIPLYLLTPFLYKIMDSHLRYVIALVMISVILLFCSQHSLEGDIYDNVRFVLVRVPSFIIGLAIGPAVKSSYKVHPAALCVALVALYLVFRYLWDKDFTIIPKGLLLTLLFALMLDVLSQIAIFRKIFDFFGKMSLETYLCNIFLCKVLLKSNLGYLFVILLTFVLAYVFHFLSERILISK